MEKIKQILYKILFLPVGFLVFLVPVSAALLIYSFAYENAKEAVKYLSYFLSAYSLTALGIRFAVIIRRIKDAGQKNKYISRYLGDAALRVKLSLYGSLALNTAYALMQFGLGIYNRSVWFYALSAYYFLLAVMRFFLLKEARKNKEKADLYREYLSYRFCGVILIFINIALSVIVIYIIKQNRGFSYHYIITIAMAAYTFFIFTTAVVNLIRYRKYNSPVISASKAINLAAALVSMLSLETAMLTAFEKSNEPAFRKIMTSCTGAAVCAAILLMSVYMIVNSTKRLRQFDKGEMKNER